MSLEEIESRIGSLIQADVISQLKSAVWKERLEGWLLFQLALPLDYLHYSTGYLINMGFIEGY